MNNNDIQSPSPPTQKLKSLWKDKGKTPKLKGWYITRTEDGFLSWRAWGQGAWWKQVKGGWIEWYGGDGIAMGFDWQPSSRQSIDLNSNELPEISGASQ